MSDYKALSGGARTDSEIMINVDNTTVLGNGSIEHPLTAVGSSTPNTTEDVEIASTAGGVVDPTINTSFVTYTGVAIDAPTTVPITIADGETDGFEKTVTFETDNNAEWELRNSSDEVIYTISSSAFDGSVTLLWNAEALAWNVLSVVN